MNFNKINASAGLLSLVVTIIGILVQLLNHQVQRKLVLLVDPTRSLVFQSTQDTLLSISAMSRDGYAISSDVYKTTLYLWNSGRMPINHNEVLQPLYIGIHGSKILSYEVIGTSRKGIDLTVMRVPSSPDSLLTINFNILELNDGCTIQLLYAGSSNARIEVTGAFVGIPYVQLQTPSSSIESGWKFMGEMFYIYLVALVAFSIFGFTSSLLRSKRLTSEWVFSDALEEAGSYFQRGLIVFVASFALLSLIFLGNLRFRYASESMHPPSCVPTSILPHQRGQDIGGQQ